MKRLTRRLWIAALLAIGVCESGWATAQGSRNDGDTVYWGAPRYTVGDH